MAILLLTRNFVICCCPSVLHVAVGVCIMFSVSSVGLWLDLFVLVCGQNCLILVVLEAMFGCSIPSRWVSGSYTLFVAHHRPMWPPTHQVGKYLSKIREILAVFRCLGGRSIPILPNMKNRSSIHPAHICLGRLIWEKYEPSLVAWVGNCIPMQHEMDMSLPHLHWWENVYPMC